MPDRAALSSTEDPQSSLFTAICAQDKPEQGVVDAEPGENGLDDTEDYVGDDGQSLKVVCGANWQAGGAGGSNQEACEEEWQRLG